MRVKSFLSKTLIPALAMSAAVLAAVSHVSCKSSIEGVQMLEGDYTVPKATQFCVSSKDLIVLGFNKEVFSKSACYYKKDGTQSIPLESSVIDGGKTLEFKSASPMQTGEEYIFSGTIQDKTGNTLTLSVPFTGFNDRVPLMAITEVHNAYSSTAKEHHAEYVEFVALQDGNLSGLEFIITGDLSSKDSSKGVYRFPPLEVSGGEYITLHLRKPSFYTGMTDDTGENLSLSSAPDSNPKALDLWAENTSAAIKDSDVLFIRNTSSSKILDSVLFVNTAKSAWNDSTQKWIFEVFSSGTWQKAENASLQEIQDSAFTFEQKSASVKKSLCRTNIDYLLKEAKSSGEPVLKNGADCWKIAEPSPGYQGNL